MAGRESDAVWQLSSHLRAALQAYHGVRLGRCHLSRSARCTRSHEEVHLDDAQYDRAEGEEQTVHAGGGADVGPPAEALLHGDEVERRGHLEPRVRHPQHHGVRRTARLALKRLSPGVAGDVAHEPLVAPLPDLPGQGEVVHPHVVGELEPALHRLEHVHHPVLVLVPFLPVAWPTQHTRDGSMVEVVRGPEDGESGPSV
mmetsp:Transcript_12184/g.25565  ORF Transcript_12184/g.25565 Transcript_12184/m.25565 type:complete len:200 (-) Transcript_12184:336-935(-)